MLYHPLVEFIIDMIREATDENITNLQSLLSSGRISYNQAAKMILNDILKEPKELDIGRLETFLRNFHRTYTSHSISKKLF